MVAPSAAYELLSLAPDCFGSEADQYGKITVVESGARPAYCSNANFAKG